MAQCEVCGTELAQGRARARRTCSDACRQAVHRRRRSAEVTALRRAATSPAPAVPAVVSADASPTGRIRAAAAALAAAADRAANAAETGTLANTFLAELRHNYGELVDAVWAAMQSRQTTPASPSLRVAPTTTAPIPPRVRGDAGPAAAPRPHRRRPLTQAQAMATTRGARLVLKDPEDRVYDVVAADSTVIGHVEPCYRAGRRSGWQGWAAGMTRSSAGPRQSTRQQAAANAAHQWVRITTAPPR
jgi:hypothetical protein